MLIRSRRPRFHQLRELGRPRDGGEETGRPDDRPGAVTSHQTSSTSGGPTNYYDRKMEEVNPPKNCVLAQVYLPARMNAADQDPSIEEAQAALSAFQKRQIGTAVAAWKTSRPHGPDALVIQTMRYGMGNRPIRGIAVVRPFTPYDPILDNYPRIDPKAPEAAAFEAALRLFFPDMVLDPLGNAVRTGRVLGHGGEVIHAGTGSMTSFGPFPLTEKFVTSAMVDQAVKVANMPGAFQPAGQGGGGDFLGSVMQGAAAGGKSGGGYGAAGGAIAAAIINVFEGLFSGPPDPPAWLTELLKQKGLRGDTSPVGPPSFGQQQPDAGTLVRNNYQCKIALINAKGSMTLQQGYAEFLRRLGGGKKKLPWWVIVAAGGAAALLGG